ncbi:hypothetical protein FOL47_000236 [Perkinsus chesapeaki]|uniref:Bromo domain-containing protein n=1 Tax=Perkinsus chesapeaki TaxID=330153 RepID=A0A7J6MM78_PERCH|nr:hypothetical protein FOL47_000236 [Perkinsus chesapeaki]
MPPRRAASKAAAGVADRSTSNGDVAVSIKSSTEESQELDMLLQLSGDEASNDDGQDFLFKRRPRALGPEKPKSVSSGSARRGQKDRPSEGKDSTGFAARNTAVAAEESSGEVAFECITNDVPIVNPSEEQIGRLKKLVACKNLFARQLPKMPKEYIAKLVFDRRHTTYTMWKGSSLIGAVCFRCYFKYGLLEIAFLAVTSDEQVKGEFCYGSHRCNLPCFLRCLVFVKEIKMTGGYGTRLMNRLKEFIKQCNPHIEAASPEYRPITHFITYADNAAVGYFAKQGFTKHVKIPKYIWSGMIKSYEGAHMMSVELALDVNYLRVADMLSDTREAVWQAALKEKPPVEMPPLSKSATPLPDPLPPSRLPGIEFSNYSVSKASPSAGDDSLSNEEASTIPETLESRLLGLTDACLQHKSSWPFRVPVAVKDAPDYYMIIKHPSDLSSIKKKLQSQQITTIEEYKTEMMWIFDNCRFYNGDDGNIYVKCARELEKFAFTRLKQIETDFGEAGGDPMDDSSTKKSSTPKNAQSSVVAGKRRRMAAQR